MGWGGNAFGPVADKGKGECCTGNGRWRRTAQAQMRGRVMLKAQIETNS
jgi:hypothetical protein